MSDDGSPRGDEGTPMAAEDGFGPAATLTRARTLIALLRSHLRLFEQSMLDGLDDDQVISSRLEDIRRTADRLAMAIEEAGRMPPRSGSGEARPAVRDAGPAAAHGESRHVVGIELCAPHLRALTESGALPPWESGDPVKVARTVQSILDRWSSLYGASARKTGLGAALADRRNGRDRRSGSPRPNCLLSYIAGTQLDRRKGDRRRAFPGDSDATSPEGVETLPAANNLVRIDGARQARGPRRPAPGRSGNAGVVAFRHAGIVADSQPPAPGAVGRTFDGALGSPAFNAPPAPTDDPLPGDRGLAAGRERRPLAEGDGASGPRAAGRDGAGQPSGPDRGGAGR